MRSPKLELADEDIYKSQKDGIPSRENKSMDSSWHRDNMYSTRPKHLQHPRYQGYTYREEIFLTSF